MTDRLRWIESAGFRILEVNFSELRNEGEYLRILQDLEQMILREPKGHLVPLLIDVTNSTVTPAVTERAKAMMAAAKEAGIPDSPTALFGLSGFQKAVVQALQFFRGDIHVASSVQDAKDWLVKQLRSQ